MNKKNVAAMLAVLCLATTGCSKNVTSYETELIEETAETTVETTTVTEPAVFYTDEDLRVANWMYYNLTDPEEFDDKVTSINSTRDDIKSRIISRETIVNQDTNWNIQISRKGLEDSVTYASKHKDKLVLNLLYRLDEAVGQSVFLDTNISEHNNSNKSPNTVFMHKLYVPIKYNNEAFIGKITVEEITNGQSDTLKRLYNLQDIKTEPLRHVSFTENQPHLKVLNDSNISIADLFQIVKACDKDFYINKRDNIRSEITVDGLSDKPNSFLSFKQKAYNFADTVKNALPEIKAEAMRKSIENKKER